MVDLRRYDERLRTHTQRLKEADTSSTNKEIVFKFDEQNRVEGLGLARRLQYIDLLSYICVPRCEHCRTIKSKHMLIGPRNASCKHKFGKPLLSDLKSATKQDIMNLMGDLRSANYEGWTLQGYKITLKKFYHWLRGTPKNQYPEEVSWIDTTIKNRDKKLPEQMLTSDEVKAIIDCANNLRDRALIATLYESGCRIGEILNLRIKDCNFDTHGAYLMVNGKTGSRRVRLIAASSTLSAWVESHPYKLDLNAPLWSKRPQQTRRARCIICKRISSIAKDAIDPRCSGCGSRKLKISKTKEPCSSLTFAGVGSLIKRLACLAKVTKKINPHSWRHSRATELSKSLTDAQMKIMFGWTAGSNMPGTYVHLSGKDVDDALLRANGLLEESDDNDGFKGVKCPRCKYINLPKTDRCTQCSMPLTQQAAIEVEERLINQMQQAIEKAVEAKLGKYVELDFARSKQHIIK